MSLEEVECVFKTGAGAQVKKVSQFNMRGTAEDGISRQKEPHVDGIDDLNTSDDIEDGASDERITVLASESKVGKN